MITDFDVYFAINSKQQSTMYYMIAVADGLLEPSLEISFYVYVSKNSWNNMSLPKHIAISQTTKLPSVKKVSRT